MSTQENYSKNAKELFEEIEGRLRWELNRGYLAPNAGQIKDLVLARQILLNELLDVEARSEATEKFLDMVNKAGTMFPVLNAYEDFNGSPQKEID